MAIALVSPRVADAVGTVSGYARHEKIRGQPSQGYAGLYEWDVWIGANGYSQNQYFRVQGGGYYTFTVPADLYSVFLHQPEWHVRPVVKPNVEILDGRTVTLNLEPATDYVAAFGDNMGSWQGAGDPWDWGTTWHQSFVALGTSITQVSFKLAGTNTDTIRVSIHEDNGDPSPANWPRVGAERIKTGVQEGSDQWIGWRSGEMPTTPGTRYAVRLHDASGDRSMGIFVHRDAVGPGYVNGTGYRDGAPQPYDLYMIVSSDSDGLVIPLMKRKSIKPGTGTSWAGMWGQTWVAKGRSLAAMDLFASAEGTWDITALVRVREGGPQGAEIGLPKKIRTAWWTPWTGILGVSYSPGEVPLEPGRTYYLEVAAAPPSTGFVPTRFGDAEDDYPQGQAYMSGVAQPGMDLEMTIVEYVESLVLPTPTPAPAVHPDRNLLRNGDMEQGTPGTTGDPAPDFWNKWQLSSTAFWYGPNYGRNGTRGARVIGGSINGTTINGGLYQRVTGLDPSTEYRFSGWSTPNLLTGAEYATYLGYDPTGQTANPLAATVVWIEMGRMTDSWRQHVSPPIRPAGDSISVWTRGQNTSTAQTFFADFDDLTLEEIEAAAPTPAGASLQAR